MSDDYAVLDTEDFWHPEYEGLKALLGCEQADSLLEELNVERPNAPRSEPYNCCEPAEPVYALPVNDAYWDDIPF
jgi:hypothetical protein